MQQRKSLVVETPAQHRKHHPSRFENSLKGLSWNNSEQVFRVNAGEPIIFIA